MGRCPSTGPREHVLRVGVLAERTSRYGSDAVASRSYELLERYLAREDLDLDLLVAPEHSFFPSGPYDEEGFRAAYEGVRSLTEGSSTLVVPGSFVWADERHLYSTTPVLCGGEPLLDYGKRYDGGEHVLAHRRGRWFAPGDAEGVFEHDGVSYGLEVCADHCAGALRADGHDGLDIQLVVANGTGFVRRSALAVREGGYAVLCDGRGPTVEVVRRARSGSGRLMLERVEPVEVVDGVLHVYELALGDGSSEG